MKEIKNKDKIYLGEYDIFVEPYLNYGQIQNIINSIKPEMSWSERQQNIEMIVLYYVTDIGMEKLEEIGHETLLKSSEENFKTMKNFVNSSERMIMTFLDQLYYQLMQIKITQMKLEFFIKDFAKQQLSVDMYTTYDKEFEKVNEKNITKMLDKEYFTNLYNQIIKREETEK